MRSRSGPAAQAGAAKQDGSGQEWACAPGRSTQPKEDIKTGHLHGAAPVAPSGTEGACPRTRPERASGARRSQPARRRRWPWLVGSSGPPVVRGVVSPSRAQPPARSASAAAQQNTLARCHHAPPPPSLGQVPLAFFTLPSKFCLYSRLEVVQLAPRLPTHLPVAFALLQPEPLTYPQRPPASFPPTPLELAVLLRNTDHHTTERRRRTSFLFSPPHHSAKQ